MNLWALLSAFAVLAAGIPPIYFAIRLRGSRASFVVLVLLLAAAFLVHGVFHLLQALSVQEDAIESMETLSAVLILAFAVAYWSLREAALSLAVNVVLHSVAIASLAATLAIFLLRLAGLGRGHRGEAVDFGAAFSVFVSGWMATELLEVAAPASWTEVNEALHLAVLALFAVWMNARWRWALRRARVAP